jgi:hypothetical protein
MRRFQFTTAGAGLASILGWTECSVRFKRLAGRAFRAAKRLWVVNPEPFANFQIRQLILDAARYTPSEYPCKDTLSKRIESRSIHTGQCRPGREGMRRLTIFFLIWLCTTTAEAVDPPQSRITLDQATALVMASLTAQQRRLPKLAVEPPYPPGPSRFLFFEVTWEGIPNGSVVVGNYAVDPYTGDVFSSTMSCYEEKNKRLKALQARIRATLHLSQSDYRRMKTDGPLCEQ